jgi:hypothetical protein
VGTLSTKLDERQSSLNILDSQVAGKLGIPAQKLDQFECGCWDAE